MRDKFCLRKRETEDMVQKEDTSMSQIVLNCRTGSGGNLSTAQAEELSKESSSFNVFSIDENRAKDAAEKLNRHKNQRQHFALTEEN